MALAPFLRPWRGDAYRNIPRRHRVGVLDFSYAARATNNRWNVAGEPTLYLAADRGVAAAEFDRHVTVNREPSLVVETLRRDIFLLRNVAVARLLDLRDPAGLAALSVAAGMERFEEFDWCRSIARHVRTSPEGIQGILVPSMAFRDDPARWVMVLFLEHLPSDPYAFIEEAVLDAEVTVTIYHGS